MTEKEAIKELRLLKPKDQGYAFGGLSNASGLAVEIAIQALEKQIPQEPMPVISDDNEFICMICPSCQKVAVERNDNFCRICGQAIDWGKEEE